MKRKNCSWTVSGDFSIEEKMGDCTSTSNFVDKPTLKSAFRTARKLANAFGTNVDIFNIRDNRRAVRLNRSTVKVFVVEPEAATTASAKLTTEATSTGERA